MNKPHVHKDVMIEAANGKKVQRKNVFNGKWCDESLPCFDPSMEYRIKAEGEYPETSLSSDKLDEIFENQTGLSLIPIANAAIKQYILDTEAKK